MENCKILILIFTIYQVTWVFGQDVSDVDVCEEGFYRMIFDDRRSSSYELGLDDFPLCDRFTIQSGNWYRFLNAVGGHIPEASMTNCIPVQHCMTTYPIWLEGSHPIVVNETVTRRVCANYGHNGVTNADKCCGWSANIKVKLCPAVNNGPNFYVYELVAPEACYIAYCGGTEKPECEVGFVSENGTCVAKCPIQAGNPTLSQPMQLPREDNKTGHPYDYEFACSVNYPNPITDGEKFEVTWLLNGGEDTNVTRTILVANTGLVARIRGSEIITHMGETIECRVRSFRNEYEEYNMCSPTLSHRYRMEIYPVDARKRRIVPPLWIGVRDELSTDIFFASTVPPVCPGREQNCPMGGITVVTNRTQSVSVCNIDIFSDDLSPGEITAVSKVPFKVKAKRDMCKETSQAQSFVLHFKHINGRMLRYDIGDIQFQYRGQAGKLCRSWGDPRFRTFDKHVYDVQQIGQFYMVRSTNLNSARHFEVQVRMWSCLATQRSLINDNDKWEAGSCVCAVAVREGPTVLGIDHCNTRSPVPLLMQYSQELETGAGIFQTESNTFKICMQSGTCTTVYLRTNVNERRLIVYADILAHYMGKLEGLCGNYDGDKLNDGQIVAEQFRIPHGRSFFEGNIESINTRSGSQQTVQFQMCTCESDQNQINPPEIQCGKDVCLGSAWGQQVGTRVVRNGGTTNGRRRKREATLGYSDNTITLEELAYEFDFGENVTGDTSHLTFPTKSGMTREEAEEICKRDVESAVNFEECLKIVGDDTYGELVENCVDDIRITDSVSIATALWEVLQESCLGLLYKGVNSKGEVLNANNTFGSSGGSPMIDSKTVIETMESQICPERCNGNGKCTNGTCTCYSGFTGSDCSLETGVAPNITGLQNNGLCDVERRPCRRVSLYSEQGRFSKTDNTKCRVVTAEMSLTTLSQPVRGDTVYTNASIVTKWEIICTLPDSDVLNNVAAVSGFWISLSFDDNIYSNEKFVTIYDSICMDCTLGPESCSRKKSTCMIEDKCYFDGEVKEDDRLLVCKPEVNYEEWTVIVAWTEWSATGSCSKPCDYGLQKSTRKCLLDSCEGETERTITCNAFNCPEKEDQKTEGVEITIAASLSKIETIEKDLLRMTSWALNDFCGGHSTKCCAQFVDSQISNHTLKLARPGLTELASGFPKEMPPRHLVFKILQKIEKEDAVEQCTGLTEPKDDESAVTTELVDLDRNVLLMAVDEKRDEISENIGYEITDVRASTDEEKTNNNLNEAEIPSGNPRKTKNSSNVNDSKFTTVFIVAVLGILLQMENLLVN